MDVDTTQIGVAPPRFVVLDEASAEPPKRALYGWGLFVLLFVVGSLIGGLIAPAMPAIAVVLLAGPLVYGLYREIRRGHETPATLARDTLNGRNYAYGEIYMLDAVLALIQRKRG